MLPLLWKDSFWFIQGHCKELKLCLLYYIEEFFLINVVSVKAMLNQHIYCSLKARSFSVPPKRCEAFKVLSVSFTQDWDLINEENNTLLFKENGNDTPLAARIDAGNYTVADFPQELARAMTAAGTQSYTVSYSNTTRKLTVTAASEFSVLPSTDGSTAYALVGSSQYNATDPATSITMQNPVNLSASYPLILTSNIPVKGIHFLNDFNEGADTALLAVVPDAFGDVVTWTNPDPSWFEVDDTISRVEFHLIDSMTGREVMLRSPLTVTYAFTDDSDDLY
ncbi:hypothetical protein HDU85_007250 [Gaertneriomyces sp. JEL0708]|nr:hypothetical protein HDU85_007250 [Gaertneriomyces sp. JEL0708]